MIAPPLSFPLPAFWPTSIHSPYPRLYFHQMDLLTASYHNHVIQNRGTNQTREKKYYAFHLSFPSILSYISLLSQEQDKMASIHWTGVWVFIHKYMRTVCINLIMLMDITLWSKDLFPLISSVHFGCFSSWKETFLYSL